MYRRLQLALACLLVFAATGVVLLWLFLLAQSYSAQSELMPWVAAGIILYGWAIVAFAAAIGTPGIVWASYLATGSSPRLGRVAKLTKRIGMVTLCLGFLAALAVLVIEKARPKDPLDGCVSYRNEAASAAMGASGTKATIECPAR